MRSVCRSILPALLALACLTGCSAPPQTAADGTPWSPDWVTVGDVLGVETPEGLTLLNNNDALEARGMFYASWSAGEAESWTAEDGSEAEVYGAQLHLLLAGYDSAAKAEAAAAEWLSMAEEQYHVEETAQETHGGQEFTVLTCAYPGETNPYAQGAAAFGVYGNYAVSAEVSCREDFDGDARELLANFLDSCHYAA